MSDSNSKLGALSAADSTGVDLGKVIRKADSPLDIKKTDPVVQQAVGDPTTKQGVGYNPNNRKKQYTEIVRIAKRALDSTGEVEVDFVTNIILKSDTGDYIELIFNEPDQSQNTADYTFIERKAQ